MRAFLRQRARVDEVNSARCGMRGPDGQACIPFFCLLPQRGARGVQGNATGKVGDFADDEGEAFRDGGRQAWEKSVGGYTGKCEGGKDRVFALLRSVPWAGRAEYGSAVCRPDVAAGATAEFAASANVYGRADSVGDCEWNFAIGDASIERDFDGAGDLVDCGFHPPFAGGREFGRAANVFG